MDPLPSKNYLICPFLKSPNLLVLVTLLLSHIREMKSIGNDLPLISTNHRLLKLVVLYDLKLTN